MQLVTIFAALAAICGLAASACWVRFATASRQSSTSKMLLEHSAVSTGLCLGLASVAALLVIFPL